MTLKDTFSHVFVSTLNLTISGSLSRAEKQHHPLVTVGITPQRYIIWYLILKINKCCKNITSIREKEAVIGYIQIYCLPSSIVLQKFYVVFPAVITHMVWKNGVITSYGTEAQLAWPVKMEGTGQTGLGPDIWGVRTGDPGGCERGGGGPLPCHTPSASLPVPCATQSGEQTGGLEVWKHPSVNCSRCGSKYERVCVSGWCSTGRLATCGAEYRKNINAFLSQQERSVNILLTISRFHLLCVLTVAAR